eukprot:8162940-Pyramimonas_sp.AAC.1
MNVFCCVCANDPVDVAEATLVDKSISAAFASLTTGVASSSPRERATFGVVYNAAVAAATAPSKSRGPRATDLRAG